MRRALFFTLACLFLLLPHNADARRPSYKKVSSGAPQYNPKYSAFMVDGDTGKILYQDGADELRHPASLTKMMTLYLLFEALENDKISKNAVLTASAYAASRPATNMSFQEGDKIDLQTAILAIIVRSANDVATMVGEQLGGDEETFAKMMTAKARQLGMKNTVFKNASGLHDPQQVTTAKDLALLAIALKKHFPQYFPLFSKREFSFQGTTYPGHNHVMEEYPGATGMKTGFIGPSGFNLVTTATRRGVSLVGVVLGGRTHQSRDANMMKLLDDGFAKAASSRSGSFVASNRPAADDADDAPASAANDNTSDDDDNGQVADTNLGQNFETNNYVRKLAVPVAPKAAPKKKTARSTQASKRARIMAKPVSKSKRYKSNMIVQTPFSKPTPASKVFVPRPKSKPDIGLGAAN